MSGSIGLVWAGAGLWDCRSWAIIFGEPAPTEFNIIQVRIKRKWYYLPM